MRKGKVLAGAALLAGLGWLAGFAQTGLDLEKLRARAERADVDAQNALGNAYHQGQGGLKQDYDEAIKWFRLAAEKGFAPAQYNLGLAYELGQGVQADERQAFRHYLMAAEQGFGAAQFNVGNMYAAGRGVGQDLFESNLWFKQAAEKGVVEAQFNLGLAYEAGRGVKKDEAQAARWYKQAADRGFPRAQHNLGLLLEDGRGVTKNEAAAAGYYRAAAEQGLAAAQSSYGIMLAEGRGGLARNPVEAWVWLSLAAANGANPTPRDLVARDLNAEQRAAATKLLEDRRAGRIPTATASAPQMAAGPAAPAPVPSAGPNRVAELTAALEQARDANAQFAEANQRLELEKARLEQQLSGSESAGLINQLRAQSQRLATQVQTLTAEKAAAEGEVSVLTARVKDMQADLARSGPAASPAPTPDVSRYERQVADLTAKLDGANTTLAQLQAANRQLTEGNARLQQEKEALAGNAAKPTATGEGATSPIIANLQRDNARLNDEVKRATLELLSLNSQLRTLRNQASQTAATPAAGDNAFATAGAEQLAQLNAKLEEASQETRRWQAENTRLAARITELENRPQPVADDSSAAALTEAQRVTAQLRQQVTELQAEKAELEKWSRSLEQTVNEKSVIAEGASANLGELRQRVAEAQRQLEDAGRENRALAARVARAEEALAAKSAEKQDTTQLDGLRQQLADAQQQAENQARENRALADKAAGERQAFVQSQARVAALERDLRESQKSAGQAGEVDNLKGQLAASNQLLEKNSAAMVQLKEANERLGQELARAKQEAAAIEERSRLAKAADEDAGLRLRSAQARVADLEKQLETATTARTQGSDSTRRLQSELARATADVEKLTVSVAELTGANERLEKDLTRARESSAEIEALRQRNEQLVREGERLTASASDSRRELEAAQSRVGELERQLSAAATARSEGSSDTRRLQTQLAEANSAVDKLTRTVAELTGANERLEKDLAQARAGSAEVAALREQLAGLRRDAAATAALREENRRLAGAAEELAALRSRSEQHGASLDSSRRELETAQARVADLEKQLAAATIPSVRTRGSDDEARKLRGELAEANTAVDKLNATVAELTGENDRLEKDLETARKTAEAALAAQSQAVSAAQPDAYRMEISTLQARVRELEGQMEEDRNQSAKEVSALAAQLARTRETNRSLTEANRALMTARQAEAPTVDKAEFDQLQGRVRDLTAGADELRRQNQKLVTDNESLVAEQATLRSQLEDVRKAATLLPGMADEKAALQERLEAVGAQLIKAQQDVDTLQKENADATSQTLAARQAAERAQAELAALQGRATDAEKTAETHNATVAELTEANTKLEDERNELRRQLAAARAESARLAQTTGSLEQLRADADRSAQQNIAALSAQLAQVQRDLQSARETNSRIMEGNTAQERDRTAVINQLRTENSALAARLAQAQGTLDQIASAARLGTPAAAIASGSPVRPAAPSSTSAAEVRIHTVAEGDSLSRISMRYYGTANRWQEIYNANRDVLQSSSTLRVGMQLRIP